MGRWRLRSGCPVVMAETGPSFLFAASYLGILVQGGGDSSFTCCPEQADQVGYHCLLQPQTPARPHPAHQPFSFLAAGLPRRDPALQCLQQGSRGQCASPRVYNQDSEAAPTFCPPSLFRQCVRESGTLS